MDSLRTTAKEELLSEISEFLPSKLLEDIRTQKRAKSSSMNRYSDLAVHFLAVWSYSVVVVSLLVIDSGVAHTHNIG